MAVREMEEEDSTPTITQFFSTTAKPLAQAPRAEKRKRSEYFGKRNLQRVESMDLGRR
jgi:hypothetical protein